MKEKVNILSLFDGISCGQVAFERAGFNIDHYYASEVDKYAIQITQKNYLNTIQLGDINEWKTWDIPWDKIDFVIGGSPCQGFSFAGKQLAFDDPRSKLFFVFVDILSYVKQRNPDVKFLLENVRMKEEYLQVINEYLGVEPMSINSALVSAQNRVRFYWFNWFVSQPEDKKINLLDIIEYGIVDKNKSYCIDANYYKSGNLEQYYKKKRRQLVFNEPKKLNRADIGESFTQLSETSNVRLAFLKQGKNVTDRGHIATAMDIKGHDIIKRIYGIEGKSPTLTTMGGGHREPKILTSETTYRKLTPIECERLQTLPDDYTAGVSNTQRYKALGNGWTVDVIVHILSGAAVF